MKRWRELREAVDRITGQLDQLDRRAEKMEVILMVREPTAGVAAEAYDGLRKQVVAAMTERMAHLQQLVQLDAALTAGADADVIGKLVRGFADQASLGRVTDAEHPEGTCSSSWLRPRRATGGTGTRLHRHDHRPGDQARQHAPRRPSGPAKPEPGTLGGDAVSVAYGIDFGTTNSVLARATADGTEAIVLDDELPGEWLGTGFDKVLPSVIGFDQGGQPIFGWRAKTHKGPKLEAVKRLFATEDQVVIGNQRLDVETAAATFFRHIQGQAAASGLMERLDRAVVTIPANSRGKARYRTKLSAGLAGIEVSALINEPTAAAMAHARAIGQNQRILVFDWGGGRST